MAAFAAGGLAAAFAAGVTGGRAAAFAAGVAGGRAARRQVGRWLNARRGARGSTISDATNTAAVGTASE